MILETIQGQKVPALGFGTWKLSGEDCVKGVEHALSLGYRHIDTAQGYSNEAEVGRGLKNSSVSREDIFLVTKLRPDNFTQDQAVSTTRESLEKLDAGYVDLLLLHWPNPDVPIGETLGALNQFVEEGSVRHLGLSNFTPSLVEEAKQHAKIFANQVEYHPYLSQDKLIEQAKALDYLLTAYSPIAQGDIIDDTTLKEIGETHGKSPVQVTLRWLVQQDHVAAIPKASSEEHREGNFDIFDFELSDEEMKQIYDLRREERLVDPNSGPDWER